MDAKEIEAIPAQIKEQREKLATTLSAQAANDRNIAKIELEAMSQASGTNETARKVAREQALLSNEAYQTAIKQKTMLREEAAGLEIEVDFQKNRLKVAEILAKLQEGA